MEAKKEVVVKKEFKVNEYITLKLLWNEKKERDETIIFIDGKPFRQCKYLLLVNPNEIIGKDIDSIDDAAEKSSKILEEEITLEELGITPDQEFIAHCSNIQAWVENDYDTRLMHSNLSFPLLKRLKETKDPLAIKIFKDEIAKRYVQGTDKNREFLKRNDYLEIFENDELLELYLTEEHQLFLKEMEHQYGESLLQDRFIVNRKICHLEFNKTIPLAIQYLNDSLLSLKIINAKIPSWIRKFKELRKLTIRQYPYEKFSGFLNGLSNLMELRIMDKSSVKVLPISIASLVNLKYLQISDTELEEVTEAIGCLKMLEHLAIYRCNNVNTLPESLGMLSNLKELNLGSDNLKSLPRTISNLENLERLSIIHCPKLILPNEILKIKTLKCLSVSLRVEKNNKEVLQKCKLKGIKINRI